MVECFVYHIISIEFLFSSRSWADCCRRQESWPKPSTLHVRDTLCQSTRSNPYLVLFFLLLIFSRLSHLISIQSRLWRSRLSHLISLQSRLWRSRLSHLISIQSRLWRSPSCGCPPSPTTLSWSRSPNWQLLPVQGGQLPRPYVPTSWWQPYVGPNWQWWPLYQG